jgi:hypothetical protein
MAKESRLQADTVGNGGVAHSPYRQGLTPWAGAICPVGEEEVNAALQFSNFQTLLSRDLGSQDLAVD